MKFEHLALNVPDVRAHAKWLAEHLGLPVLRALEAAPFTHFLGDETGRVFLELYSNPKAPFPDYAALHPLNFHVAFFAPDAAAAQARLVAAGATPFSEEITADGSRLIFVRDPWGLPLQFCQRTKPFAGF